MSEPICHFCPSCSSKAVRSIGEIPSSNFFAGRILEYTIPGGNLHRCNDCCLYFRHPSLTRDELNKLYSNGNTNHWQYELEDRIDWRIAINYIKENLSSGKILDVGCFDGAFLKYLGKDFDLCGVETNKEAIKHAEQKGIHIITQHFHELHNFKSSFDTVVGFDVVEHVQDPFVLLKDMKAAVCDNGLVIVSSGNTESLNWKFMGSKYWYCGIAEHISFINTDWCYNTARLLNLEVEFVKKFSHAGRKRNIVRYSYELLVNMVYKFSPALIIQLRRAKKNLIGSCCFISDLPPAWMSARDHIIVVFRKRN